MKLAESGSRGVFWRLHLRGTQQRKRSGAPKERGDWWIRWACPHGHLHRARIGPKSLAQKKAEQHRLERPCPARRAKPATHLLADVIREYLDATKNHKRSRKDDARYGDMWSERFKGRTLDEITAGDVEKIRAERLEGDNAVQPAT